MSKMKTYYHEALMREVQRSQSYQFTLPVSQGEILDDQVGRLAQLSATVRSINALGATEANRRYVIDLKWRGPRDGRTIDGRHYTTARQDARAVDVYVRRRRDWEER